MAEIELAIGLLRNPSLWRPHIEALPPRVALITDEGVPPQHVEQVERSLEGLQLHKFTFPAGEAYKTRRTKEWLEDQMTLQGLGRDTVVVAVGGGVVTDVAGFVAATYCRGLPWIAVPTTLMGMVDASIGGKVGLNTPYGKNLIGALHPPRLILIDPETLTTLPLSEWRSGTAELIKYGAIASPALFAALRERKSDLPWMVEIIGAASQIKEQVARQDPSDRGLRRILNFGHTVGHALETACNYTISHGEAVALGMIAESELSCRLGRFSRSDADALHALCCQYDLGHQVPSSVTPGILSGMMHRDKKAQQGSPRLVLLTAIGTVDPCGGAYCTTVDPQLLNEVLSWLCQRSTLHPAPLQDGSHSPPPNRTPCGRSSSPV